MEKVKKPVVSGKKLAGTFVKGDPRINLAGRPKGSVSIVEGIRQKLEDIDPKSKKKWLDLFLETLFQKAVREGNEQLMKDMINRIDGMPKQSNDITTNGKDLPTPILGNVHYNIGNEEVAETTE